MYSAGNQYVAKFMQKSNCKIAHIQIQNVLTFENIRS
jgi:hypothetical protein